MTLTTFPTEQARQGERVRVKIRRDTVSDEHGMVQAGQVLEVHHHEYLQLKAAGAGELAKEDFALPQIREAGEDDYVFLKVKGYRPQSVADTQRFLDAYARQGQLGGYQASLADWVKAGKPGAAAVLSATPADGVATDPAATDQVDAQATLVPDVPAKGARKK